VYLTVALGAGSLGGGCSSGGDCIDAVWLDGVRYDNAYSAIEADGVGELVVEVADSGCSDAAIGPVDVGEDTDESINGAATVLPVGTAIHLVLDDQDLLAAERDGTFELYKRASG
jgi:hypothetical protein